MHTIKRKVMLISCLTAFIPFYLMAQAVPFQLEVQVPNFRKEAYLYFIYTKDAITYRDSVKVQDGKAEFKGTIEYPVKGAVRLELNGKVNDLKIFYLEPGSNVLVVRDSLKNSVVAHSTLNDQFEELHELTDPLINKIVAIKLKAMSIPKSQYKRPEMDSLNKHYHAQVNQLISTKSAFIRRHPDSYISLDVLKSIVGNPIKLDMIKPLFDGLSSDLKSTPKGRAIAKSLQKAARVSVGAVAPAFISKDTTGKTLSLQQVLANSQYVLIDFWASWCSPCRAENPNVVANYHKFHEKGLNIISISLDSKKALWLHAIRKDGMPWIHLSSLKGWEEPVALLYDVQGIPDNFLLDKNGVILARGLRGEALTKKLATLMP